MLPAPPICNAALGKPPSEPEVKTIGVKSALCTASTFIERDALAPARASWFTRFEVSSGLTLLRQVERSGQVTHLGAYSGKWLEPVPASDQLQDRGRVVGRLIDEAAFGEWRHDERRNTRGRPPTVAPSFPRRRRN